MDVGQASASIMAHADRDALNFSPYGQITKFAPTLKPEVPTNVKSCSRMPKLLAAELPSHREAGPQ
jgi:hypothetical protein